MFKIKLPISVFNFLKLYFLSIFIIKCASLLRMSEKRKIHPSLGNMKKVVFSSRSDSRKRLWWRPPDQTDKTEYVLITQNTHQANVKFMVSQSTEN